MPDPKFLYELTWPEVVEQKLETPLNTYTGELVGGKDRRGQFEVKNKELWLLWVHDVNYAATKQLPLREDVVMYFNDNRGMEMPGDTPTTPQPVLIKPTKKPNFSWSYSAMNDYENCPYAYAQKRYYKNIPYVESEAQKDGNRKHKAAEIYLKSRKTTDHEALKPVKPYADLMLKAQDAGATLLAEQELGLDRSLKPCGVREWGRIWGRAVVDAALIKGGKANVFDWKAGDPKWVTETQLKVNCLFLAIHHPEIEVFDAKYIWLRGLPPSGLKKPITRKELLPELKDIIQRVARMEESWNSESFSMKKNGLCKGYCDCFECPHNGRKR